MEKNAYIHFVDERDFKEVSVVGKRQSKKNGAVGFVLTAVSAESTSEDDEVESDCSSEIGSSSAQPDENSDESTEEGSCNPEEFSENEATGNHKPKASSFKKITQARGVKHTLTEDEVEELCDKLEIKREELDREIKKKHDSSANLSFYPCRTALMAAVLADKVGVNEVTSEFVDDFIQVIHDKFHSSLSATDKNAALV